MISHRSVGFTYIHHPPLTPPLAALPYPALIPFLFLISLVNPLRKLSPKSEILPTLLRTLQLRFL